MNKGTEASGNKMEIILGINQLKRALVNPVVTLGNFDGVHLGHQKIFERLKEEALKIRGEAIVITFEPHPLKVLSPQHCPPLLTPFKKKMMLIEKSGIGTVLCIEFSLAFSELPWAFTVIGAKRITKAMDSRNVINFLIVIVF